MYEELKKLKKPWRVNINTYGHWKCNKLQMFCMNKNTGKTNFGELIWPFLLYETVFI